MTAPEPTPFPECEIDRLYAVLADCAATGRPGRLYDMKVLLAALPEGPWQNFLIAAKQLEKVSNNGFRVDLTILKRIRREGQERNRAFEKQQRSATLKSEAAAAGKPLIIVNGRQLSEVRDEAIKALRAANSPPVIFKRPGDLVRFVVDVRGEPALQSMDWMAIRSRLTDVAVFVKKTADGSLEAVFPPASLCEELTVFNYPEGTFPTIEGIARTPLIRPDGSIFCIPGGYDPRTKTIYAPPAGFELPPVPEQPTDEQIAEAKQRILELIQDFDFESTSDRDNFIAFLLTPLVRHLIDVVPLVIVDSPVAGAGKGLLTDLVAIIATGEVAAAIPPPAKGKSEWPKLIFSLLDSGRSLIIFDNLRGTLDSAALEAALTKPYFRSRILGRSEERVVKNSATWAVTGTNVSLSSDAVRRSYLVRVDPKMGQPYLRRDFKHPDLVEYCKQERGNLLAALLILIRGWYAAGRPAPDTITIGTFTRWRALVGGVLGHAGFDQFLKNQRMFFGEVDIETEEWEAFLLEIRNHLGGEAWRVSDLVDLIESRKVTALPREIAGVFGTTTSHRESRPNPFFAVKIGHILRTRLKRRFGSSEVFIEKTGTDRRHKVALYQIKFGKPNL